MSRLLAREAETRGCLSADSFPRPSISACQSATCTPLCPRSTLPTSSAPCRGYIPKSRSAFRLLSPSLLQPPSLPCPSCPACPPCSPALPACPALPPVHASACDPIKPRTPSGMVETVVKEAWKAGASHTRHRNGARLTCLAAPLPMLAAACCLHSRCCLMTCL